MHGPINRRFTTWWLYSKCHRQRRESSEVHKIQTRYTLRNLPLHQQVTENRDS